MMFGFWTSTPDLLRAIRENNPDTRWEYAMTEPREDAIDDPAKQSTDPDLPEQATGNDDTAEADEEGDPEMTEERKVEVTVEDAPVEPQVKVDVNVEESPQDEEDKK